jgi:hypothetical protein
MEHEPNAAPNARPPLGVWFRRAELAVCLSLIALFAIAWRPWRGPLIFQADSPGYLAPALADRFEGQAGRSIGYPAFLNVVVDASGAVGLLIAQAAVAVAAPLFALAIWRIAAREKTAPRLAFVQGLMGVLMIVAFLSFQPFVGFAHMVMAESLAITASLGALMCVFIACADKPGPIVFGSAFLGGWVSAAWLYLVKPQWGALWLFLWFALAIALLLRSDYSRLAKAGVGALALALYGGLVWAPQHSFSQNDIVAENFGPRTIICNNLDIIEPTLGDLETAQNRNLLEQLRAEMRNVLNQPRGEWRTLGFDGDACMYRSQVPELLERARPDAMGKTAFSSIILGKAVAAHPVQFLTRIGKQLGRAIFIPFPGPADRQIVDPTLFERLQQYPDIRRLQVAPSLLSAREPAPLADTAPPIGIVGNIILKRAKEWFWPVLVGASLATFWALFRTKNYLKLSNQRRALVWWLAAGAYFSSLAVVALVHSFDITRYRQGDFAFALIALFVGAATLLDFFWRRTEREGEN